MYTYFNYYDVCEYAFNYYFDSNTLVYALCVFFDISSVEIHLNTQMRISIILFFDLNYLV